MKFKIVKTRWSVLVLLLPRLVVVAAAVALPGVVVVAAAVGAVVLLLLSVRLRRGGLVLGPLSARGGVNHRFNQQDDTRTLLSIMEIA